MKTLLLGLFLGTLIHTAHSQELKKNDWQDLRVSGKVKSLHETWYKAINKDGVITNGKKISKDDEIESLILFNERGYKIEDSHFNTEGNLTEKVVYAYDDRLNRNEEIKYDASGSIIHKGNFIYKYDNQGKIVEEDWLETNGSISGKAIYKYDEKGNLTEKNWFKADGTLNRKMIWVYDDKRNIIETTDYNSTGEPDWKITYKVDEKGKLTEETWFKNATKFYIKYTYSYDLNGNKSEMYWIDKNGKSYMKWNIKYEYDSTGNWIKEIQFGDNKPASVTVREIKYF